MQAIRNELDVLVIGGGIQGIWTLNKLTKSGYSVILITNSLLGNGQTFDSQLYKHRGHFYNNVEMAQHLKETDQEWNELVTSSKISKTQDQAFLGFHPEDAGKWRSTWDQAGLDYSLIDLQEIPQAFKEGELKRGLFYHTNESCLNGRELVGKLAEPVKGLIFHGQITRFEATHGQVKGVHAVIDGQKYAFTPKYVVLTAGCGNQDLLHQITKDEPELFHKTQGIQQLRRCQVLCLKGKNLPSTTCLFPGLQLFVGCRQVEGENIWLVTYGFDDPIELDVNSEIPLDQKRLQRSIKQLQRVIPDILNRDLDFAIYPAVKAESKALGSGFRPNDVFVDNCGLNNVLTVYPTKLSLVPRSTTKIVNRIQHDIGQGQGRFNPSLFSPPQQEITIGKERWQTANWLKWPDFSHQFLEIPNQLPPKSLSACSVTGSLN